MREREGESPAAQGSRWSPSSAWRSIPHRRKLSPKDSHAVHDAFDTAFDSKGLGATIDAETKCHDRSAVDLGLAGIPKGPVWLMKREASFLCATTRYGELTTAHPADPSCWQPLGIGSSIGGGRRVDRSEA